MATHSADTPDDASNPGVRVSPVVLIAALVAILMFGISAVTYLVSVGRDPNQVVALLTGLGAPTVTALIALMRVEKVQKQTNGHLTQLQGRVMDIEEKVSPDGG